MFGTSAHLMSQDLCRLVLSVSRGSPMDQNFVETAPHAVKKLNVSFGSIASIPSCPVSGSFRTSRFAVDGVALAAEGETMVNRVYHLDRGFERLEDKLAACGATIQHISA